MERDSWNQLFREMAAKIEECFDKKNQTRLFSIAMKWLDDNKTSLKQDGNAKMLVEDYWLEAIDPFHRYGPNLSDYHQEWKSSGSYDSFFKWLDLGDGTGRDVEGCTWLKLMEEQEERERFEVMISSTDGRLVYKTSNIPVDTKEEALIFVLSLQEELFVGMKKRGLFHHSSFLAGAPVLAAGYIEVVDGTIKDITMSSGHYRPTKENFERLTLFLKERRVAISSPE